MMSCKLLRCIVQGGHDEAAVNIKVVNFKKNNKSITILCREIFFVKYNAMTLSIKGKSQYSDVCMFWGCSETCVDNLISEVLFLLVIIPIELMLCILHW